MTGPQRIGRTIAESEERWERREPEAPDGAPDVLLIVLDDVGFAQLGCFGGSIETPNIDRLADEGLRYTNFHTTAVCSPTRASLLTGRNCHSVGFGHVTERLAGFPGYSMRLPDSAATIAEILRTNGYSTRAVGKWHLTPSFETGPQGPFDRWPIGRGFQRFYGFLGGSTDQYAPELFRDNSPTVPPAGPGDGYHLTTDLVDETIRQITDLTAMAPARPFFAYLATGAGHVPHQAPAEWIDRYRGAFDHGWDVERERILHRQIELGVVPEGTALAPSNPGVQRWDDLSPDERRLYARMMEVYAGFLSHTDAQIGRLIDHLADTGRLDDTIVMLLSDNGASAEGGPHGSVDEGLFRNDQPQRLADALDQIDELGGPKLYNHYPWGWAQAGNTPFRWYKQFTHAGGITNGLVVRWPDGGLPAGELRPQYHHVIDVVPTLLDAIGIETPVTVGGVTQQPIHGLSMTYSFDDAEAPGRRHAQHYEMWGNRGFWLDGWMAVCRLHPDAAAALSPAEMVPFDDLVWELYDHTTDPAECHDLATQHPEKLRELQDLWWAAAGRYDVLPIDTRARGKRWPTRPPTPLGANPATTVFTGPGGPFERGVAPALAGGAFHLEAEVDIVEPGRWQGTLYSLGGLHGGYWWYVMDGEVRFEIARSSVQTETVGAPIDLPVGRHTLAVEVTADADLAGQVTFWLDGEALGGGRLTTLLRRVPIGCGRTYVGRSPAPTVAGAFRSPFEFEGVLARLTVTSGPGPTDAGPPDARHAGELAREMREQ